MSQPNQKPNQGPAPTQTSDQVQASDQVVDIDQLEVEVLIICKNPAGFQQSASFLSRRGWPTTVMGNLGKAIDYIVKNQPDFVMISSNHPNPGTFRLPNLLSQMKTNCIGFTETGDAASNAKLATMPFKNKLQGLPSGPNVQRMIRKILIDIYNPQAATKENEGENAAKENDNTIVRGGENSAVQDKAANSHELSGEESIDAGSYRMGRAKNRKKLKDLVGQDQDGDSSGDAVSGRADKKALMDLAAESEGKARGESGMMLLPTKDQGQDSYDQAMSEDGEKSAASPINEEKSDASGELSAIQKEQNAPGTYEATQDRPSANPFMAQQDGITGPIFNETQESPDSVERSATKKGTGPGTELNAKENGGDDESISANPTNAALNADEEDIGAGVGQNRNAMKNGPIPTQQSALKNDKSREDHLPAQGNQANEAASSLCRSVSPVSSFKPFKIDPKRPKSTERFQELFEKAIQLALERTCVSGPTVKPLSAIDIVGALPIDSSELHGYLVISISGVTAEKHAEFMPLFRQTLGALFLELNVPAQVEEGFVVIQEPFEYFQWAKQEAALCLMAEHEGHMVGAAFLPTEGRGVASPRDSGKPDMALIDVDAIETDKPIPFKAYLHFRRSDRFFLYLRNGRRLFPDQKDRLLGRKVSNFYINIVDVQNYKIYTAANFICRSLRRTKPSRAS